MAALFSHPLARHAKVWSTAGLKGKPTSILIVMTTLELDPSARGFKADKVKRLSDEAASWVRENPVAATDYVLVSRAKEWDERKS